MVKMERRNALFSSGFSYLSYPGNYYRDKQAVDGLFVVIGGWCPPPAFFKIGGQLLSSQQNGSTDNDA
jgi:hypothetical protein